MREAKPTLPGVGHHMKDRPRSFLLTWLICYALADSASGAALAQPFGTSGDETVKLRITRRPRLEQQEGTAAPPGANARPDQAGPGEALSYARPDANWFRDALRWDESPVDLSFLNAGDRPAGRHGFVKVDGDKLVFEDGTPARFWGTNLAGPVLFSTPHNN